MTRSAAAAIAVLNTIEPPEICAVESAETRLPSQRARSGLLVFLTGPCAMPARHPQVRMLADPAGKVGLRLHRAGPQRAGGLVQQMVLVARLRRGQGACQDDEVDQIHAGPLIHGAATDCQFVTQEAAALLVAIPGRYHPAGNGTSSAEA